MKYVTLKVQRENEILTIMLNRPDVHNAMNEQLMKDLICCFNEAGIDNAIRMIILTGLGKSFCAGADLNWMRGMINYSKKENIRDSQLLLDLYDTIYQCPKPVIGKINGHAFGGGVGLIAVCDIAMASPRCEFAFSEIKLGIIPSVISTFVIPRLSGISHVRRLFLTGERFSSEYAKKIGLLDYIFDNKDMEENIKKYCSILRTSGPKAIMEVKNLIKSYEELSVNDYKRHTVEKIAELRVSKEGQEGINAFLGKRKPSWSK
jgi:methylglutaconyl-CoA hydratase